MQTSRSSPCARHVVRCCHAAGFEPNVSFESDDYQTVQGLVAAGVGVALIPELALSVVREDVDHPRPLPPPAGAPGDRRCARGRRPGARRRRRCWESSNRPPGSYEVLGAPASVGPHVRGGCHRGGYPWVSYC